MTVPGPPVFDAETSEQLKALVAKGAAGGLFFATDEYQSTTRNSSPAASSSRRAAEQPYGVDAGSGTSRAIRCGSPSLKPTAAAAGRQWRCHRPADIGAPWRRGRRGWSIARPSGRAGGPTGTAPGGDGGALLFEGPAGIGKTALLEAGDGARDRVPRPTRARRRDRARAQLRARAGDVRRRAARGPGSGQAALVGGRRESSRRGLRRRAARARPTPRR